MFRMCYEVVMTCNECYVTCMMQVDVMSLYMCKMVKCHVQSVTPPKVTKLHPKTPQKHPQNDPKNTPK